MSALLEELNGVLGAPVDTEVIDRIPDQPSVRVVDQENRQQAADRVAEDYGGGLNENRNDPLDRLYGRIMGLDREDYAVPAQRLVTSLTGSRMNFHAGQNIWRGTDHAVGQLSDRLSKGLRSFGNEMKERGHRDLQCQLINDLLQREPDNRKFQVRTIQPNGTRLARAVMSDRFKPIDDNILIDPMVDLIADHSKDWRSLGGQISDTHTRIRYITREPQVFNIGPNNRDWHVGFQYHNSEVGASKTGFSLFVFDAFCENGCVFGGKDLIAVNFVHKGTQIKSDFGLISDERIQQAELMQIRDSVVEATRFVLGQDFTQKITELVELNESRKLEGAANDKIRQIKVLGDHVGLTKTEQETVVAHWDSREDNAFGVSNAITRLAQDAENYESRVKLETAGGKLLEMPENRWKSLMALAS